MISKNINYIPKLDHLRFLAAMLVFSFHLYHYYFGHWQAHPELAFYGLITEGHTGIALFFTLSGFIFMTIAQQKGEVKYWVFINNRFLRIFPLFLVIFFVAISIGRDNFLGSDIFYLFFSNLGRAPTSNSFITGAAWTISVEFTFYLIFPFLARFTREHGISYLFKIVLILLFIKIAAFNVSEKPTHMFYSTLVGRFDQFIWGMIAAWLYHQYKELLSRYAYLILMVSVLLLIVAVSYQAKNASYFLPHEQKQAFWIFWSNIEASIWSVIIIGYLSCKQKLPQMIDKWLSWGGELSYSFYLWHGMIFYLAYQYLGVFSPFAKLSLNYTLNFVLVLSLTLFFSRLSYKTIELPFLSLRRRYLVSDHK